MDWRFWLNKSRACRDFNGQSVVSPIQIGTTIPNFIDSEKLWHDHENGQSFFIALAMHNLAQASQEASLVPCQF